MPDEQLLRINRIIARAVQLHQLTQKQWRLQTDILKQAFMVAGLFANCDSKAVLVDGHFSEPVKTLIANSDKPLQLINRRCFKYGLTGMRLIVLDTMSGNCKRRHGLAHLHFHAAIEIPLGMTQRRLKTVVLPEVFGCAKAMGRRQFNVTSPNYKQGYTHARRAVANGPIGKWFYAVRNAGTTINDLKADPEKRSRRAGPKERRLRNAKAEGLAQGTGTAFNKAIVFADNGIKAVGEAAYKLWLADQVALAQKASAMPTAKNTSVKKPKKSANYLKKERENS